MRSFWEETAVCSQRRSSSLVASPPAFPTRSATEGVLRTTITRCPTATRGRCAPANPCQLTSCGAEGGPLPPPPAAIRIPVTATARAASTSALNGSRGGRVGIESKIAGIGDGLYKAGRRGDHGGVVGTELQRSKGCTGKGSAKLRVGGDSPDYGDRAGADLLRRP